MKRHITLHFSFVTKVVRDHDINQHMRREEERLVLVTVYALALHDYLQVA